MERYNLRTHKEFKEFQKILGVYNLACMLFAHKGSSLSDILCLVEGMTLIGVGERENYDFK